MDNKQLLSKLNKFFEESYGLYQGKFDKWKGFYKRYKNELVVKRLKYKSVVRKNYCYLIPAIKIPILVQNNPTVNYLPYDSTKDETARLFSKFVGQYLWSKLKVQDELLQAIMSASIYDYGLIKLGYNKSKKSAFVKAIDVFKVLIDPIATSFDNARYVIYNDVIPIDYLKSRFPEYKDQITPDLTLSKYINEERKYSHTVNANTKLVSERASVKEYWVRDDVIGEKGNGKGWFITVINDSLIVRKEPSPYKHGKPPYVLFKLSVLPNEFGGMGDIEQIIPLQDGLNHLYQMADDITTRISNVGWQVDPSVGKKIIKQLVKTLPIPGGLKVVPLNALKQDTIPQFPTYLFNLIQFYERSIETISGITDVMQGRGDVRHRTAHGLEILYETGTSRITLSRKLVDNSLKELAYMLGSVVQQFYNNKDKFAIVGNRGLSREILEVNPAEMPDNFEITIDSGIAMPQDKSSRAETLMSLADKGILQMAMSQDPIQKAVSYVILQQLDIPFKDALISGELMDEVNEIIAKQKEREMERKAKLLEKQGINPEQAIGGINEMAQISGQSPDQFVNMIKQQINGMMGQQGGGQSPQQPLMPMQ